MDVNVAIILQVGGHPLRVGRGRAFINAEVIGRPTPPPDQRLWRRPRPRYLSDGSAVALKLLVVVVSDREHQPLRIHIPAGLERKAEIDLVLLWRVTKRFAPQNLGRAGGIYGIGSRLEASFSALAL